MPSGHPLSEEQRRFIDEHIEDMFINQIARELQVARKTVKRYIKRKQAS
ncbi:MAG: hypothetical protein A4E30_00274 [Methanomassiliicoccales archaeon PtaB.Bin215]|nr:helix-turn-helix domain-containing protein [Methanomassiliicoccus sp.]OPX65693.1 MAG: hypothetical protein A4E30_00274 [Methanomassiliicoccales archaeon PtaB.Bin215]